MYLAGGHIECGCGFPDTLSDDTAVEAPPAQADVQSMHALGEWLRPAIRGQNTARVYLCWPHRQHDPPKTERTVTLATMFGPGFRLRHHQILTISGIVEPRRRPTRG
jgi:hypothetical protein